MDDITWHGEAEDVLKYLNYLMEKLPLIGLNINTSKSEMFGIRKTRAISKVFTQETRYLLFNIQKRR
jgi:hypothetical protein